MKQKWKWGVAVVVFAGAVALAADLLEIAEWMKEARNENQDKRTGEVKEEPVDEITIVLTELENDTEGFGVSIKRTIKDAGWEYRRLKRTVKDSKRIERSREKDQEAAKLGEVREQQGGDVIVWGEVDSLAGEAIIKIQGRGSEVAELVASNKTEGWKDELIKIVEEHSLQAAIEIWPKEDEDGVETLKKTAGKLQDVIDSGGSPLVQKRARAAKNVVGLALARVTSNATYAKNVRKQLKGGKGAQNIGGGASGQEDGRMLAEALMLEGLIEGDTEKVEQGMKEGLTVGAPNNARVRNAWWLESEIAWDLLERTTNLVIACRDKELIYRVLHMYLKIPGCTDSMGGQGCPMETTRAVIALRYMRHIWVEEGALASLNFILNEERLPYWYPRDHWGDPFTHAARVVTDEIARRRQDDDKYETRDATQCPSLEEWGTEYGWIAEVEQLDGYSKERTAKQWEEWWASLGEDPR